MTAGFLAAGFVAALVPASLFETIFPQDLPTWLLAPIHALLAPVLAIFTVIGSMGNGAAGGRAVAERRRLRRHHGTDLRHLR